MSTYASVFYACLHSCVYAYIHTHRMRIAPPHQRTSKNAVSKLPTVESPSLGAPNTNNHLRAAGMYVMVPTPVRFGHTNSGTACCTPAVHMAWPEASCPEKNSHAESC